MSGLSEFFLEGSQSIAGSGTDRKTEHLGIDIGGIHHDA
jgi:hypothetical protein